MISGGQEFAPQRPADAEVTLADLTRIRTALGWEPKVQFAEGLRELRESAGMSASGTP